MPIKNYKKKSGFSLVEILIYIAIFSVFVISLVSFNSSLTASRLHNQMMLEVNDQGEKVMKIITQTLRNSSQVNSPTIGSAANNLSVVTGVPVNDPTVFSLSGGVLYITEGAGSPVALTNNQVITSSLLFSNFSRSSTPNIIKVSFTLASIALSSSPGGTYSFTFNGSAALRK